MEYGKSTYRQIIDDVLHDINEDEALARKTEASFINDILRAEEIICQKYSIEEEYRLRLTADVTDYNVQDRPAITGVTAATPPVVTSSGHGLADGDVINIRDVQGTSGINGRRQITYIGATSFSLKEFFRVTGLTFDSGTGLATVTTDEPHGWSTGNTITLVDTGDAALDGAVSITVTGAKTFTYAPAGDPDADFAYAGGGYATKPATGTGTWTSGGRYWKEDEVPTHIWNFRYALRTWNAFTRKIEFVGNGDLVEAANVNYTTLNYGSYYAPTMAVHTRVAGVRIIRFYPTPPETQDVKLYGVLRVTPHLYYADPTTAVIHLDAEHNALIKQYVKSCAYNFMKKRDEAKEEMGLFYAEMKEKQMFRQMKSKMAVTYR